MKIDYISDLHLDMWVRNFNEMAPKSVDGMNTLFELFDVPNRGEVLIVAGDIGHYNIQDVFFLKHVSKLYNHVFFVRGNHDMYLISNNAISQFQGNSQNRIDNMKELVSNIANVHYLDGDVFEYKGIKFAGVGMSWDDTYFNEINTDRDSSVMMGLYNHFMSDATRIFENVSRINDFSYNARYISRFDPLKYFIKEKAKLDNIKEADVIITHYAPLCSDNVSPEYRGDDITTFFQFNGIETIERLKPKLWVYGHMHGQHSMKYDDTTVVRNGLGYPKEFPMQMIMSFEI